MADETQYRRLTREELEELAGEPLSEHAATSLLDANVAVPVNPAVSAKVFSAGSTSEAAAEPGSQP